MKKQQKRQKSTLRFFAVLFYLAVSAELLSYEAIQKHEFTVKGEAEYAQGNYNEAIKYFEAAMEGGETRGEPYFFIGSIWELRREYEKAVFYFENALMYELQDEFREAALWKLVLLQRNRHEYEAVLEYLDALEELGVTHPNLAKFREEALKKMDPDKSKARELLGEARRLKTDWEKLHLHQDFWDYRNNKTTLDEYLSLHQRAIYLDEDLDAMNWTLAGYYEKVGLWGKASVVYKKIESRLNSDNSKDQERLSLVYYKIGVAEKKEGHFSAAAYYLKKSRESLVQSSASLATDESKERHEKMLYSLDVNLAQSYLALHEFQNAQEHSLLAIEKEGREGLAFGAMVYCLASYAEADETPVGKTDTGQTAKVDCEALAKSMRQAMKIAEQNPGALLVIRYFVAASDWKTMRPAFAAAEAEAETPQNDQDDKEIDRIAAEYRRVLFPPRFRNSGLASIRFDLKNDLCEGNYPQEIFESWECPPYWLRKSFDLAAGFFYEASRSHDLYLLVRFYPESMHGDQGARYLAWAARVESQYQTALSAYAEIENRDPEEESWYLLLLARYSRWQELEQETVAYLRAYPEQEEAIFKMFLSHPEMKGIPLYRFSDRFKTRLKRFEEEMEEKKKQEEEDQKNEPEDVEPVEGPAAGEGQVQVSPEQGEGEAGGADEPADQPESDSETESLP